MASEKPDLIDPWSFNHPVPNNVQLKVGDRGSFYYSSVALAADDGDIDVPPIFFGTSDHQATTVGTFFISNGKIDGDIMGLVNDGRTRFDESYPVKEDYELCLRCIAEDGGIVAARFLYWHNRHWADPGGCRDYRTQEMERDCIDRLIAAYPGYIRKVTKGGSEFSIQLEF